MKKPLWKKSSWKIHKDGVKTLEQTYGVPLKRVKMSGDWYYIAKLPKNHPLAKKTGNRKHLIKVKATDTPHVNPRMN